MPRQQPLTHLPASHKAWDEMAEDIPRLFRTYTVRKAIHQLPILSARAEDLPDEYLLRASSLFSILAHLYWYCEPEPPEGAFRRIFNGRGRKSPPACTAPRPTFPL
ncbi:MAG: hypothetical protein IPL28_05005 [Chloroflexi bacterium]|nr:hypothetical protein [Chloroflexota bacterium]